MKKELNKGVTLIALIITIIVLLILAGITLAMVVGDNGIMAKAGTAKNRTNEAQDTELNQLDSYEDQIATLGRTLNVNFNNINENSYEKLEYKNFTAYASGTKLMTGTSKFGTINNEGELTFNEDGLYYVMTSAQINAVQTSSSQLYNILKVNCKDVIYSQSMGNAWKTVDGSAIFYAKKGDKMQNCLISYNATSTIENWRVAIYKVI